MLVYILKSAGCLAILFLFYKLFLEDENMHVFKRYYLLLALIISMLIPTIVFTEYVEVPSSLVYETITPVTNSHGLINVPAVLESDIMGVEPMLWVVYFIGLFFFGIKFIKNLSQIFRRIRKNPKQVLPKFIQVLHLENQPPHTFFKYIFLNKRKLEANEIPNEVLLHEETHARQKHSLDVVFVELLQVVLWFNPFVYLVKKAIKLNHEFLADQGVLNKGVHSSTYQKTLLAFSSNNHRPALANAINYSSIKKRFTIMKAKKSKKSVLLRTAILIPLTCLLLYGFSEKTIVEILKDQPLDSEISGPITNVINEELKDVNLKTVNYVENNSYRIVEVAGLVLDSENLSPLENVEIYNSIGKIISKTDSRGYYKVQFNITKPGEIFFEFSLGKNGYKPFLQKEHWGNLQGKIKSTFYFGLQKNGNISPEFSQLMVNNQNLSYESIQNNLHLVQSEFQFNKKVRKAKKENQKILIEIDNAYYLVSNTGLIKINSKNDLISLDDNQVIPASKLNSIIERKAITGMTPLENEDALFAIYTTQENIYTKRKKKSQESATREQMAEYDKLARHYNSMSKDNMKVKYKDIERLKYIYSLMSDKQRKDAEPFPNFPPPPTAPKAPSTVGLTSTPAPVVLKGEVSNIPPPPAPPSPLDHVIAMAKKNATFYYEGKEITSDKAIALLKNNKSINIDTRDSSTDKPVVRLSTKPITITIKN